jgi:hypothetical protein
MATFQGITASNNPCIDPDAVEDVEAIIADYEFVGAVGTLTVAAIDPANEDAPAYVDDDAAPHLVCYGGASFDASKPVTDDDGHVIDHEYDCTEEFLTRLAPHLTEQLVVETVGFEKFRFPLLAGQWVAWPDGTVAYDSFDHSPKKPVDSDTDDKVTHPSESSA